MFGGFGNPKRHYQKMKAASKLPKRKVTRAEFDRLAKAGGWSPDKIKLHGSIAESTKSYVQVGSELLAIEG